MEDICVGCQKSDQYGACISYSMAGQMFRRRRIWQLGERCPILPSPTAPTHKGRVRIGQQKQKKVGR